MVLIEELSTNNRCIICENSVDTEESFCQDCLPKYEDKNIRVKKKIRIQIITTIEKDNDNTTITKNIAKGIKIDIKHGVIWN